MEKDELWSWRRCGKAAIGSAEMTLVDGHKQGFRFQPCLAPYLHPANVFPRPVFWRLSWGNVSPGVNKRHYVLLIILNKCVDTNMTRSHSGDLWSAFWQLSSFMQPVGAADVWREAAVLPANYRWQDGETCHSDFFDKWRKKRRQKHLMLTKKKTQTRTMQPALFDNANFARKIYLRLQMKGTDLRSGSLIIYPAGFMALINFPLPLSLYLPLEVWSQPASGADKAGGGLSRPRSLPSNPSARASAGEKRQLSSVFAGGFHQKPALKPTQRRARLSRRAHCSRNRLYRIS